MDPKYYMADETAFEHNSSNLSGVIHDVKNLMCAVINTAELLTMEAPEEHTCCKKLQMIIQITQQCIELLVSSQSAQYGYGFDFETIELKPIIDTVVSILEFRNADDKSIEVIQNDFNPILFGNKTELESALLNICLNAVESMQGSGTLRICTSSVERQGEQELCSSAESRKKYIQIEISDTGTGIAPEKISFIFNPFYTTKQKSGTPPRGMGLFRTKNCISAHGGSIGVQSTPSRGTTFTIQLPAMHS